MVQTQMKICRVFDISDPGLVALVARSDDYLSELYPPESNHAEPLDVLVADDAAFFAGYIEDDIVACGAIKLFEGDVRFGEVKRVFVDEKHRGKRLAVTMMQYLEAYLLENGIHTVRLEAGPLQPEALSLYRKLGYRERGPFGHYRLDPLSVFMEKELCA